MLEIDYYIIRVRQLPPKTAAKRAAMKLLRVTRNKFEKEAAKLSQARISDQELLRSLEEFVSVEDFLLTMRGERPPFFIQPSSREEIVSLIQQQFPHLVTEIEDEAEKVCNHVFDLLGSGPVDLDEFAEQHGGREACGYLPWHHDFKTGYHWSPKKFYKEIEIPYGKADIKVPWEISRFQHVAVIGQAYWLTGEEKYAQEFVRQVDDWIDHNPPKFGVNWYSTMDVAIRVANWIYGFYVFKDSKAFTDDFLTKFTKRLLVHGRYIMANLENKDVANNHYLSNLVGLIYLGIAFPEFKEACRWRDFGIQELIKEMECQVYNDGMDFEASTCYHRLALEFFFYPDLLCRLNGIELPEAFTDKLKKMFDFVLYVLKPNGKMPPIGDNDNGRLHLLRTRNILDMTYLLSFAAIRFNAPRYKIEEFGFAPEALWLFGPEGYEQWSSLSGKSVEELGSKSFSVGGIYVMRHKKDYMAISCGPNGQGGIGGHAHNDKLSFVLCVDGEDIIVDPGTCTYTSSPEWRNKFRSTEYHNTVSVDEEEQNKYNSSYFALFRMKEETHARCLAWCDSEECTRFVGEHFGYMKLDTPLIHVREVWFLKKRRKWVVRDFIIGSGDHLMRWTLHVTADPIPARIEFSTNWLQTIGHYSTEYGSIQECRKFVTDVCGNGSVTMSFSITVNEPERKECHD